jgi:hypothetical protein
MPQVEISGRNALSATAAVPEDWLSQQELAALMQISERTASKLARAGHLKIFEHGVQNVGRRRYSRALFQRHVDSCMKRAAERQDAVLESLV